MRRWVFRPIRQGLVWLPQMVSVIACGIVGKGGKRWQTIASRRSGNMAALGRALVSLVPAVLAFLAALMPIYLVYAGWLYPLRPETFPLLARPMTSVPELNGAWGGDYLIGAWFGHAAIGTGIQIASLVILYGLLWLRSRVVR